MTTIKEILEVISKDGDHFIGFLIALAITFAGIVAIIKAIKKKN